MTHTEYFHYFGSQLKIETSDNGAQRGSVLDWSTGQFVEAPRGVMVEAQVNMTSADIWRMTFEEFVSETERARATFVSGEGPVFPLYQIAKGIYEVAQREKRRLTREEMELINRIYQQTFALWEAGEALS
ncbi:hypothetical protein [Nocardia higoensis]|uniref:hypothetical protein n=1 Tax=Nocardia higoensis TaxID=228599 RepID=UPI0012F66F93|nr:hypothetical protein [Nocardia higoensis]